MSEDTIPPPIQTDSTADTLIAQSVAQPSEAAESSSSSSSAKVNGTSNPTANKQATVADEEEELKAEIHGGDENETAGDGDVEMKADGVAVDGDVNGNASSEVAEVVKEAEVEVEDPDKIPDDACETLYLQNLNEKVRLPVMKETLASLFKPYKIILPVVAHRNVRMRGQAFVTLPDKELANKARKEVQDFPLYGRAIQISFARTRSDVAVKRIEGDERLEEHKKERLAMKKIKRRNNPLRQKAQAKLKADESGVAPAKKQRIQMPDEYLPPNNVLFIQNLPEGTTQDDLREVFEVHPGLVEIRTIPAKKDIAFVEFADETLATVAKEALHNFKIDGETKMKVTYARK